MTSRDLCEVRTEYPCLFSISSIRDALEKSLAAKMTFIFTLAPEARGGALRPPSRAFPLFALRDLFEFERHPFHSEDPGEQIIEETQEDQE